MSTLLLEVSRLNPLSLLFLYAAHSVLFLTSCVGLFYCVEAIRCWLLICRVSQQFGQFMLWAAQQREHATFLHAEREPGYLRVTMQGQGIVREMGIRIAFSDIWNDHEAIVILTVELTHGKLECTFNKGELVGLRQWRRHRGDWIQVPAPLLSGWMRKRASETLRHVRALLKARQIVMITSPPDSGQSSQSDGRHLHLVR